MEAKITVTGIVPLSQEHLKFKQIWDMCFEVGVTIPIEIVNVFKGQRPLTEEKDVEIRHEHWADTNHLKGIIIDVNDIPTDVTKLAIQVAK